MSDINNINNLETTVHNKPIKSDHKTEYITHFNNFFDTFKCSVTEYRYEKSIEAINDYYDDYIEYGIIPYMNITNYIYALRDDKETYKTFIIENLLKFIGTIYNELVDIKDKDSNEYIRKHTQYQMVFRIYAHTDLANIQSDTFYQISDSVKDAINEKLINDIQPKINENARKTEEMFNKHIENFNQDMKKSERDYITILGIFVAIILAFIGSIIFPIKVIESVSNVSVAKLILLFSGISFIFINMLYLLIRFIVVINDKKDYLNKKSYIVSLNIGLFLIFILSIVGIFYSDNLIELQQKALANSVDYKQGLLDNKTK